MAVAYGRGNVKLGDVELGSTTLSLAYLANAPLVAVDHTVESSTKSHLRTLRIARVRSLLVSI